MNAKLEKLRQLRGQLNWEESQATWKVGLVRVTWARVIQYYEANISYFIRESISSDAEMHLRDILTQKVAPDPWSGESQIRSHFERFKGTVQQMIELEEEQERRRVAATREVAKRAKSERRGSSRPKQHPSKPSDPAPAQAIVIHAKAVQVGNQNKLAVREGTEKNRTTVGKELKSLRKLLTEMNDRQYEALSQLLVLVAKHAPDGSLNPQQTEAIRQNFGTYLEKVKDNANELETFKKALRGGDGPEVIEKVAKYGPALVYLGGSLAKLFDK